MFGKKQRVPLRRVVKWKVTKYLEVEGEKKIKRKNPNGKSIKKI